jgi:hypothetical protein
MLFGSDWMAVERRFLRMECGFGARTPRREQSQTTNRLAALL